MTIEDEGPQTEGRSARERLRSGAVETLPPDMTRIRRAAAILLVLGFVGVPSVAVVVLDSDPMIKMVAALILIVFAVALGYLMVRTIRRR